MIGIALGIARREAHLAGRRRCPRPSRRGRSSSATLLGTVVGIVSGVYPGAPRVAARSDRSAATRDMTILSRILLHAFEGVGIALESIRANKGRAALTILGVAVGVFVVVALSSVVRGVNESFARDVAAAGPDVVLRLPAADLADFKAAIRATRAPAPSAATRRSRSTRRTASRRSHRSSPSRSTSANGAHVQVQGSLAQRRRGVSTRRIGPTSTAATSIPAAASRYAENNDGRAGRDRQRQAGADAVRRLRSDRQDDHDRRTSVSGHRPVSLHGEPDGHADVGRRRRFAEGDHPARDGPPAHEPVGARQQSDREAARRRDASRTRSTTSPPTCARIAVCARATGRTSRS